MDGLYCEPSILLSLVAAFYGTLKKKRWVKRIIWMALAVFDIFILVIYLWVRLDTGLLWRIVPWNVGSETVTKFCDAMIQGAEHWPSEEQNEDAYRMAASMLVVGSVGMAAQTSQDESLSDQVLSQYTVALVRARLLMSQGDFSEARYQLYKLPFKSGNTWLMQRALPALQQQAQLPEGFLSQENIQEQQEREQEAASELQRYKEEHIYGRYYQYGYMNLYLEIGVDEIEGIDVIRFVHHFGEETQELEQKFRYEQGKTEYETMGDPRNRSVFTFSEADELILEAGGFEAPARFLRLQDDEFVIPDSSLRILSREELLALDEHERWLAKNEIYARHNYPFRNEELQQYFGEKRWYRRGEYAPEEFQESSAFSEIEQENIRLFTELES